MTRPRSSIFKWGIFIFVLFLGLSIPSPNQHMQAATEAEILYSEVVCAPGTHSSCLPGPYTETMPIDGMGFVRIAVFLEHTGHFEPNEQSDFSSALGDVLGCGPIAEGEPELYCGEASGRLGGQLDLTVHHSGGGSSTGSHRQRYEITVLPDRVYFPIMVRP